MSDSDDDWFEKDLDSFTVDVKKPENVEENVTLEIRDAKMDKEKLYKLMKGEDVSSYQNKSMEKEPSEASAKAKPKLSFTRMTAISKMSSLRAFSELYNMKNEFLEALKAKNMNKNLIILTSSCLFLACDVPFEEHKYILMKELKEIPTFWTQLAKYVTENAVSDDFHNGMEAVAKVLMRFTDISPKIRTSLKSIRIAETNKSSNPAFWETFSKFLDNPSSFVASQDTILPTTEDLLEEPKAEISPNIVKGAFSSVLEYRKTHMALLKEDFISPLRESIALYIKNYPEMTHEGLVDNIFVMPRVQLGHGEHGNAVREFVDLKFNENEKRKQSISWSEKRFLPGSLLIFTSNVTKLDDLILATVLPYDNASKNQGIIPLTIIRSKAEQKIFDGELTLIEPTTFFEPYNHVFNVLSNTTDVNMPMKRQIVDADVEINAPKYLKRMKSTKITEKGINFDISDVNSYPKAELFGLDASQMDAYKAALTRDFCLIQGPPGTGKTHIGLEIVKTLLRHTKEKILIVCYTNHALDQTLNGILEETDKIVRFGEQSKHEVLQNFTYKEVGMNRDHLVDGALKHLLWMTKQERNALSDEFHKIQVSEEVVQEKVLENVQNQMVSVTKRLFELNQLQTLLRIQDKRVFGMTTTFAARCHTLLQLLQIPIVLFEEAGEILESHIVTSLTPKTEQLILIGDHYQLKPNTTVYRLAKDFHMNLSLFERMINNNVPYVQLKKQHRMRPCIAELIRDTIYPELEDAENVLTYPNVPGMGKNLYFIRHEELEMSPKHAKFIETSKQNEYEAEILVKLCLNLIEKGTAPEDITILTMYQGQKKLLHEMRMKYDPKSSMKGTKITVVDNFQGEENKIILLSLVRSNLENSIGFVGIRNRVCVALSRAKEGMYVMGNMKMLKEVSGIWKKINEKLEKLGAIGDFIDENLLLP
ncbi:NFX1-type zinc finger-containing protein 1 [Culicoides brevitarsis]|uniref:NFX1-type zinc finger-containing protein 1 n=1 Tax=Culicoides brevitarsis TaxID=469753 RepID=UPI00307BB526